MCRERRRSGGSVIKMSYETYTLAKLCTLSHVHQLMSHEQTQLLGLAVQLAEGDHHLVVLLLARKSSNTAPRKQELLVVDTLVRDIAQDSDRNTAPPSSSRFKDFPNESNEGPNL